MKTTTKKTDSNSSKNQAVKGKFVEREVKACFSYEMDAILTATNGATPSQLDGLPRWEEVENLFAYTCPDCGHIEQDANKFGLDSAWANSAWVCPSCKENCSREPASEPQEVFEWWIVTEWLAKQLSAKGEPVLEWGNNWYWGRTTTGQAILLDGVITSICSDLGILEGQANEWKI